LGGSRRRERGKVSRIKVGRKGRWKKTQEQDRKKKKS
jgi:hypothetical protein